MSRRITRKQKQKTRKRKQKGGTRKMRIRKLSTIPIWNVRRPGLPPSLPPRKPYNHLRGMNVDVVGEITGHGPFIEIGGKAVLVEPKNIESIDPPAKKKPCFGCGLVPEETTQDVLLSKVNPDEEGREEVEQNEFKIGSRWPGFSTTGLATCAALQVELGGQQFLAHVSATTDMEPMKDTLKEMLTGRAGKPSVSIWTGQGGSANDPVKLSDPSSVAVRKISDMLKELGITEYDENPVCFAETVPM